MEGRMMKGERGRRALVHRHTGTSSGGGEEDTAAHRLSRRQRRRKEFGPAEFAERFNKVGPAEFAERLNKKTRCNEKLLGALSLFQVPLIRMDSTHEHSSSPSCTHKRKLISFPQKGPALF